MKERKKEKRKEKEKQIWKFKEKRDSVKNETKSNKNMKQFQPNIVCIKGDLVKFMAKLNWVTKRCWIEIGESKA